PLTPPAHHPLNPLSLHDALPIFAAPLAAHSQARPGELTYRCVSKDGKKYYGSTLPQQCIGQPVEQLSTSGIVVRRISPEGDEKADRKSTRLNSSHVKISYAVFCL